MFAYEPAQTYFKLVIIPINPPFYKDAIATHPMYNKNG
jgi:hypothetical protein